MSGTYIDNQGNEILISGAAKSTIATTSNVGIVKPDGISINISADGTIECDKETIVGWGMPDLSAITQITLPYTAPKNGYILRNIQSNSYIHIKINNVDMYGGADSKWQSVMNPVDKNSAVTCTDSYGSWTIYFIPCKGAI